MPAAINRRRVAGVMKGRKEAEEEQEAPVRKRGLGHRSAFDEPRLTWRHAANVINGGDVRKDVRLRMRERITPRTMERAGLS